MGETLKKYYVSIILVGVILYLANTSSIIEAQVASDINESTDVLIDNKDIVVQTNREMKHNERRIDASSTGQIDDVSNPIYDDNNPKLVCGQMEEPNNIYILFSEGNTDLCYAHKEMIDRMLNDIGPINDYRFEIRGYINSFTGTFESNEQAARQMTANVVKYLKEKGVPDNNIMEAIPSHTIPHDINNTDFGADGLVYIFVMDK